jgi:hypothetical protein
MAYMNFQKFDGEAIQAPADAVALRQARHDFTALEWSVVALAQKESLSSLKAPGRIASAIGSLFGVLRNSALADPQLEALRRMAVLAWHHGYKISLAEVSAFFAAGYAPGQYERLLESVARGRNRLVPQGRGGPRLA